MKELIENKVKDGKLKGENENKEVARHFRSNKHKITDFKICVFKSDIENDEIRKNMEQDLINRLNTNKIRCINKITSKKSKKFVFKK